MARPKEPSVWLLLRWVTSECSLASTSSSSYLPIRAARHHLRLCFRSKTSSMPKSSKLSRLSLARESMLVLSSARRRSRRTSSTWSRSWLMNSENMTPSWINWSESIRKRLRSRTRWHRLFNTVACWLPPPIWTSSGHHIATKWKSDSVSLSMKIWRRGSFRLSNGISYVLRKKKWILNWRT